MRLPIRPPRRLHGRTALVVATTTDLIGTGTVFTAHRGGRGRLRCRLVQRRGRVERRNVDSA